MKTDKFTHKYEQMRHVGKLTSDCFDYLFLYIRPGISTQDIDDYVASFAKAKNLTCATLGYRGFPAHCCTSINKVCCHGIPSKTDILQEGDIVKVDLTFINEGGYHGDACKTFPIGDVSLKARKLIQVAYKAMWAGIKQAKYGNKIIEIGRAIDEYVKSNDMSVAPEWLGHGIGLKFHDKPSIYHIAEETAMDSHIILEPGMTFTIEPIVNFGKPTTRILSDEWTVVTCDRSLSAQFEHTIGITEIGNEVFTI